MTLTLRAVVVHRASELDELIRRHGTRQAVGFFLASRGRNLDELDARKTLQTDAMRVVASAIPLDWRRTQVERGDLARFVFGPEDVVVAVGQDGLVANVAKYLTGQPVIGVNPEPTRNPGVLVRHAPDAVVSLFRVVDASAVGQHVRALTMVDATLDDGQRLVALNEIYVGHPSHQSARYRIVDGVDRAERQSSSGVLFGSGTGSTGWCRSAWLERQSSLFLPDPDETALCWFVREAWPSSATGTVMTEGRVESGDVVTIVAESDLVVFGDGVEDDRLLLTWGQSVQLSVATNRLHLVV